MSSFVSSEMGYILILVLLVAPACVCPAPTTKSADAPEVLTDDEAIHLNDQQILLIRQAEIDIIKEKYWSNRTYYSKQPPIVTLTEAQIASVISKYSCSFTAEPPETLGTDVYGGVEKSHGVESGTSGDGVPAAASSSSSTTSSSSGNAVCPSTGVYEEITFAVNGEDELLQMIQLESLGQWILDETCQSTSGSVAGTICEERERSISAVVVNLETSEITNEQIKVFSCAAYEEWHG